MVGCSRPVHLRLLTGAAATVAACLADPAAAQVLEQQGVDYATSGSPVTVSLTGLTGVVPVILTTTGGWSIDASGTNGSVQLSGTQSSTTGPGTADALLAFLASSNMASSATAADATDAGSVTVTAAGAISLSGVSGVTTPPAGLSVVSRGAEGFRETGSQETDGGYVTQFPEPSGSSPYSIATFSGTQGSAAGLTIGGGASVSVSGTGSGGQVDFLTPTLVSVAVGSFGGDGSIGYYTTGIDQSPTPYPGNGGGAGNVTVTTAAGSAVSLAQTGAGSNAVGLSAISQGGNAASADLITTEDHFVAGSAGAAGSVSIKHAGRIDVQAPWGTGIFAESVGGNGNISGGSPDPTAEGTTPLPTPANGGSVGVTLATGGTVTMAQGGIGVLALSRAGDWTPTGSYAVPTGGPVTVTLEQGATIATEGAAFSPPAFSFGVLAVSAGQSLVSDPAIGPGSQIGAGSAGAVTVSNQGTVSATGELAAGLAALAIGGAPIVTTVSGGTNYVGNSSDTQAVVGGSVTVTNTGSITTSGTSAYGIAAISAGGGGIVKNEAPTASTTSGWTSGTSVGSYQSTSATNAATVTVTHSGTISTGAGSLGGDASFGILAQSIGGSGGTVGGSQPLQYVGDTSGGGGTGGEVSVLFEGNAALGTTSKNAHGVLIQSIGGGGGNGANGAAAFSAVGGSGGNGGNGGTSTFTSTPAAGGSISLTTLGNYAAGAVVQSVGGGGGNGGMADSAGLFYDKAVGGTGGGGGAGGTAGAYNNAGSTIDTRGNQSSAVLVHSVGGGGGYGGSATSYSAGQFLSISGAVGGTGGSGGAGGLVTGINHGSLTTGVDPASFANVQFQANTGTFYGVLPGNAEIRAYFTQGGISGGTLSGSLVASNGSAITLSDGTVLTNVSVLGDMVSGTIQATGAPYSATLASSGIYEAVATDSAASLVSGLIVGGLFTPAANDPNPNGADSGGLVVQSIGGGGGAGGAAAAKALVLPEPGLKRAGWAIPTISVSHAIGGTGGSGGNGGGVTAGNYAAISTFADSSRGILAQSIGQGGGSGGDATASSMAIQSAGYDAQVTVGFAGAGGSAGSGATVTAFNGASDGSEIGSIRTYGQYSAGIVAQSIGGGGGAGGVGSASGATPVLHTETKEAIATTIGVGGAGGSSGSGGSVTVTNSPGSTITTSGSTSPGILAQSIGSGGGDGGGGSATGGGDKVTLTVSVGGSGAAGGNAGVVQVQNSGTISTMGGSSHGIVGQSVGGGGGTGGTADASAGAPKWYDTINATIGAILSDGNNYAGNVSVGGSGGGGGNGGSVTVTNATGSIVDGTWNPGVGTAGSRAFGIVAQSIGGGGGTGAASSGSSRSAPRLESDGNKTFTANVIVGGGAGQAGNGGNATITNTGVVTTRGYGSAGLVAQAIGGSGGMGADGSVDSDVTVRLGDQLSKANPGTGYVGGTASVVNPTGAGIMTMGRDAPAIVAQSIGGGGGIASAGDDSFAAIGGGQAGTATHTLLVGGTGYEDAATTSGFPANSGAAVGVTQSGQIVTQGDWSHGIVAQSIGGGGGLASAYTTASVTPAITIGVARTPSFGTFGNYAYGDGGAVTISLPQSGPAARISTGTGTSLPGYLQRTGYSAYGIVAQSIGGGGGIATEDTAAGTLATGSIAVGGNNAGNGGTVAVSGNSVVGTIGDAAHGLVLQSIGMGGGIGGQGSSLTPSSPAATNAVSLSINPQTEYLQGGGGSVTVTSELAVTTSGADAFGLLAQSIGGGGGLVFAQNASQTQTSIGSFYGSPTYQLSSSGGPVSLTLSGSSIATVGDRSHAIVAQSVGGGGGIVGYGSSPGLALTSSLGTLTSNQLGAGGAIDLTIDADIATSGAGAYGILAQSVGGGGGLLVRNGTAYAGSVGTTGQWGGSITIAQSGTIVTSGTNSVAIFAQSTEAQVGYPISITLNGTVEGGGGSGAGVWVDGGLANGLVIGSSGSLEAESNTAVFYTGDGGLAVDNYGTVTGSVLIDGSLFTNAGVYNVGDGAAIEGYFTQESSGTLTFNFGPDPSARLNVQYDTNLYGTVRPIVTDWLLPASNAVIEPGTGASVYNYYAATPSTPLFGWNYFQEGIGTFSMTPYAKLSSAAAGLSQNERAAAGYLQSEWTAANPNLSGFFADLYNQVGASEAYQTLLDDMSPVASQTLATNLSDISGTILGAAMSCPEFAGGSTLIDEGTCVWGKTGGDITRRADQDSSVSRWFTGAGGQKEVGAGWAVGGMLGTDVSNASGDGVSGSGNAYYGTLALKHVDGPWTFAAALAGAVGTYSIDRRIETDGTTTSSEQSAYLAGLRGRAAYDFAFDSFYVRPQLDVDLFHIYTPGYSETGASAYALQVDAANDTALVLAPAVELGVRQDLDEGTVFRGFLSLGAAFDPTSDRTIDAGLKAAGSPLRFSTEIDSPDVVATFGAGVQLYRQMDWDVRGEYTLAVGDGLISQGGQLRLSRRF